MSGYESVEYFCDGRFRLDLNWDYDHVHGDSFVVETDVHYPTDSSLLYDAMGKVITHGLDYCRDKEIDDFKHYVALAIVAHNLQAFGRYSCRAREVAFGTLAETAAQTSRLTSTQVKYLAFYYRY